MTAPRRRKGDAQVWAVSPGISGWCIDNLHAECAYAPCTCTRCDPDMHHSRAGQAPRIPNDGDLLPWDAFDDAEETRETVVPSAA